MSEKLIESLRKIIQKEIKSALTESTEFKVGEIYRDTSTDIEYQVTPMPDKFKGKHGAGTLNIWVTNLDTDEKLFIPVSILKHLKQVYVTPPEGRLKHLKASTSRYMYEGPEEYRIGTEFTVTKSPDSALIRTLKSAISAFYDSRLQPKKGDKFQAVKSDMKAHVYLKNLNRPDEMLAAMGPIADGNATIAFPIDWFKDLESKGYFKVDKIGTGNNLFDYKSTIGEGPEELGAYRRLVITSNKNEQLKTEFNKFMSKPEIKTQYPGVKMKIIDSPKPDTIVVDVNGDKATVIGIKLGDIVKRVDSAAKVIVRKERKLK